MAATITRTPMPVRRARFIMLDEDTVEYYERRAADWPEVYPYPYVCHACSRRLTTGDRCCTLLNTSNDYATWCADCASVFDREPGY